MACHVWVFCDGMSVQVEPEILDRVRSNFVSQKDVILAHNRPWTPWALTHLLEIDDNKSSVPAEVILYKALKASAADRICIQDADVQVCFLQLVLHYNSSPFLLIVVQEVFVTQADKGRCNLFQRWSRISWRTQQVCYGAQRCSKRHSRSDVGLCFGNQ